jgi:hypothetical protein
MNDAQVWTLIGGFFALMVAHTALVLRVVHTDIGRVTDRLDNLDRDVQRLVDEHYKC